MESSPRSTDHGPGPVVAAICTAAASSLAGVYVVTSSIPVTIIAAAVVLGLGAFYLALGR
jgi:hypothetical protein